MGERVQVENNNITLPKFGKRTAFIILHAQYFTNVHANSIALGRNESDLLKVNVY